MNQFILYILFWIFIAKLPLDSFYMQTVILIYSKTYLLLMVYFELSLCSAFFLNLSNPCFVSYSIATCLVTSIFCILMFEHSGVILVSTSYLFFEDSCCILGRFTILYISFQILNIIIHFWFQNFQNFFHFINHFHKMAFMLPIPCNHSK